MTEELINDIEMQTWNASVCELQTHIVKSWPRGNSVNAVGSVKNAGNVVTEL